jgi:hypothetical protein
MALNDFNFNPPEGWNNETEFPDYPQASEVRPLFQKLFDQIKVYLGLVKTEITAHLADDVQVTNEGQTLPPHGLSKCKLDATTYPTENDDSSAGYSINSEWVDTIGRKVYKCLDATVGAAVWKDITAAGGELEAGNLEFITSYSLSAEAAYWDIPFPANARRVEIMINALRVVTNSSNLKMQVSNDGGTTFKNTAYHYAGIVNDSSADTISALRANSADSVTLTPALTSSTAARISAKLSFYNTDLAYRPNFSYESNGAKSSSLDAINVKGEARFDSSLIINAIRLYASSGNIVNGRIDVYAVLNV